MVSEETTSRMVHCRLRDDSAEVLADDFSQPLIILGRIDVPKDLLTLWLNIVAGNFATIMPLPENGETGSDLNI